MIKKIILFSNTLKYLKFTQLFYQVYYRLKPSKTLNFYTPKNKTFHFKKLLFKFNISAHSIIKPYNNFNFLNISKQFPENVDWNFLDYGKLWNYNLQYFNFLHQPDLDKTIKDYLLLDITKWLKNGKLKLEPYPVSLRTMNTIRYCSSQENSNEDIVADIYSQLNYLSKRLEFHILGNHLLENAFALMMGGAAFDEKLWINTSKQLLYKQLHEQIVEDGAHFELSPMYHQIILFRVLELIDWYQNYDKLDEAFLLFLNKKASKMLAWLKTISFKNGDIPHLNDSAPGIALSTPDLFKFAEKIGVYAIPDFSLKESGYRKYTGGNYECVMDVNGISPDYQPGHNHADHLSFVLYVKDKPFIVDPGTSTYAISERRQWERSSKAHNTVTVDDQNQSQVWGGFRVGKRANVKLLNDSASFVKASISYTTESGKRIIHTREFNYSDKSIAINDKLKVQNLGCSRFYMHPDIILKSMEGNKIVFNDGIMLNFANVDHILVKDYSFAYGFNKLKSAKVLEVYFKNTCATTILID